MEGLVNLQVGERNGVPTVASAKELYLFLGYLPKNWNRWYPANIVKNKLNKVEGRDWWQVVDNHSLPLKEENLNKQYLPDNHSLQPKVENLGGRPSLDFEISFDFAERLSMQTGTKKTEEIQSYFIKCRKMVQANQHQLPTDYEEALEQLLISVREQRVIKEQLQIAAPKAEAHDAFMGSGQWFSMEHTAKCLKMGRTKLFRKLREANVIQKESTIPYQKYIDDGAFEVRMVPKTIHGKTVHFATPFVSPKGLERIRKRLHIEVKQLALPKGR